MRAGRVVRQALYSPRDPTVNTRRRAISISAEDKKRANLKTSYEKLLMLACANFLPGDWWVTLTYDDTFLPESREESRKYWRKSMRWYRKYRKDNKDALRYVYCTQLTTSRGGRRLHHHMILRYEDDMDQEKLESLWQWGHVHMRKLKDWDERPNKEDDVNAVIGQIYGRTADIKDAQIFAVAPPMISGYGTSTGFSMHLQDKTGGDLTEFYNIYLQFIGALNQRPEIARAYSTFNINFPQYMVDIDAAKAKRAGISPTSILSTLAGYYGGQYVSNINRFSKMYYVTMQADPKYRLDTESLNNVYVRSSSGEMAPLGQFVNLTRVYSSEVLNRFNMYSSIAVNGTAADGYSSGDAIRAIQETAAQVLPKGYGYEFDGITREEAQTGSNTVIIFGICILLIYLILSALYESFLIPFAVILSVPCGLMGSFLLAKMMGLENNIYLQTGIIMLIGLLSKTAILITEYAADRRAAGMSLSQAAVSAAKARLRPILMTVLTCVFGMIPLVLSHGVGANGNSTLGAGVIGGMIVGTLALLFLVPTLFIVFQTLQEKVKPLEFDPDPQWAVRAELEECKNEKEEE